LSDCPRRVKISNLLFENRFGREPKRSKFYVINCRSVNTST